MPIGSFQSAWEGYEHTDGPALLSEARDLEKTGAKAPNWRLKIGGEDYTRRLISASVTYSREGTASMQFAVIGNLRAADKQRAPMRFWIGYGTKLIPYFTGRLANPVDSPSGLYSEASAYALATQLGQRYFQHRTDYAGWDLRAAVNDLWDNHFGASDERLEFLGMHSTTLAEDLSSFGYEVSMLEALQTLLEPMQFIAYDQLAGIFTIKRNHLASLGTVDPMAGAGHYDPHEYPKDGFTFDQSMANFYDDVTIFRRKDTYAGGGGPGVSGANPDEPDSDEYDVFVNKVVAGDSGISNPNPFVVNEGRDFVVADYPGQQEHAARERGLLVASFSRGVGRGEWECFPCDYDLGDHVVVRRDEQIHDPAYLFSRGTYRQSQIDRVGYLMSVEETNFTMRARMVGSTAVGAESWAMNVAGPAFEAERTTIRPAGTPITIDLGVAPDPVPEEPQAVDINQVVVGTDDVVVGTDRVVVP